MKNSKTIQEKLPTKPWIKYKGAQQKCFDRADEFKDEFIVVKQEPYQGDFTNTYNSFKDVNSFLEFQKGWQGKHTFNELIRSGKPCKEYYDIDGKWSDGWESIQDAVLSFFRLRFDYSRSPLNTINKIGVDMCDLTITEACNDVKLSLHIIIETKHHFKNTDDQRIWATGFSEWIKLKHPESKIKIDLSVYNNNSIMRCRDSCKVGDTDRPFRPWRFTNPIGSKYFCSYVDIVNTPIYVPQPEKICESSKSFPKLTDIEELETCKAIVKAIKAYRAENYIDWFAIGSALHNTLEGSEEGLELFLLFSQMCPEKYDEDVCTNIWSKLDGSGYTKGTLVHYFNEDRPKILKKRKMIRKK